MVSFKLAWEGLVEMTMTPVLICKRNAQSSETVGSLLSNEFINVKPKGGVYRYLPIHPALDAVKLAND